VEVGGGALPAVRIDLIPFQLNQYGVSLDDVRAAVQAGQCQSPQRGDRDSQRRFQIYTNTIGLNLDDYRR